MVGCGPSSITKNIYELQKPVLLQADTKFMKVHMKNGDLYVMSEWNFDNQNEQMNGKGKKYNANRKEINNIAAMHLIPFDEIALLETSDIVRGDGGQIASMSVLSLLNLLITVPCLTDPKACFGSCPTFYAYDGDKRSLMAEGFSSSIARIYEEQDIDMLYHTVNQKDTFELEIRNEALETHMIRYCDLFVVPRLESERIFKTPEGQFYNTSTIVEPISCITKEGDILNNIKHFDKRERYSLADSSNLIEKEIIEITFPAVEGDLGLVIASRQTLMTTFLLYQTMAYMGNSVGYWTAKLNGDLRVKNIGRSMFQHLGGIEIICQDSNGKLKLIHEINEMGPIASDVQLIKLPSTKNQSIHIKLRMTKGLWRIDYLALAKIDKETIPIRLKAEKLILHGSNDDYKDILNDTSLYLKSLPGDRYTAKYIMPEEPGPYEYFINSKGYYLEWMRKEWIREEDPKKVIMAFKKPKRYLKEMAALFKKSEPYMESVFWNSKHIQ